MEILNKVALSKKHARTMGRQCRAKDRAAILSAGGWTDPERWVRAQANRSIESWAFTTADALVGVAGVMLVPGKYQLPWFLGTDLAEALGAQLLPTAREQVERWRDRYSLLLGMLPCSDTGLASAAQALGFTLMAPEKFGKRGDLWCKAVLDTRRIEVVHG